MCIADKRTLIKDIVYRTDFCEEDGVLVPDVYVVYVSCVVPVNATTINKTCVFLNSANHQSFVFIACY